MAKQSTSGPWARFRAFRYTRPFWAGAFTVVAGVEILLFPLTPVSSLIQLGIGAISGVLFGIALVILGLFMWFSPPNRTLSGVLTILIALASFVTSNLGGLVVGMVLGLIGGGLCLAWAPRTPPAKKRGKRRFPWSRGPQDGPGNGPGDGPGGGASGDDPAAATEDLFRDDDRGRSGASSGASSPRPGRRRPLRPEEHPGHADPAVAPPRHRPVESRRRRVAGFGTLLAAALLGSVLATPGVAAAQECLVGLLCESPPASSTPTQAPPSPGARTNTTEGGGADNSPSPTTEGAPTPSPPGGPLGGLSDGLNGALGALPVPPLPALTPAGVPLLAELLPQLVTPALPATPAQDGIVVSGLISNTTMDTLTVTNFRFLGVVTHRVAGGGTIRALRAVVDTTDIGNLGAHVPGPMSSLVVNQKGGSAHAITSRLILDFTKLKITVFGVLPLEFSFAFPPPPLITIPVLSGTDVDIDFVQLDTSATIPGLVVGMGPPSTGARTTDTSRPADSQSSLASLVGLASALNQPNLLAPYGLTDAQSRQAMAAYKKDPAAVSAASAQRPAAAPPTAAPTPTPTAQPGSGAEGGAEPATPTPLLGPGA